MRSLIAAPILMLAACGGEDASIVGTWENAQGARTTYHDNGAVEYNGGGEGNTGRWSVEGDRLFIESSNMWAPMSDSQFAVDADSLVTSAMRPDGAVDGVVGTWVGTAHGYGATDQWEEFVYRLTLNADGTGSFDQR